jgi:hypothetical protein
MVQGLLLTAATLFEKGTDDGLVFRGFSKKQPLSTPRARTAGRQVEKRHGWIRFSTSSELLQK